MANPSAVSVTSMRALVLGVAVSASTKAQVSNCQKVEKAALSSSRTVDQSERRILRVGRVGKAMGVSKL